jgi:hypothetical protein
VEEADFAAAEPWAARLLANRANTEGTVREGAAKADFVFL